MAASRTMLLKMMRITSLETQCPLIPTKGKKGKRPKESERRLKPSRQKSIR
jgi:hypothetical protein